MIIIYIYTLNTYAVYMITVGISFCEHKYEIVPRIAEFFNSISNVSYLFAAAGLAAGVGPIPIAYTLGFVGIGSFFFHSTGSVVGEMIDEWAMICFMVHVFCMLNKKRPNRLYPLIIFVLLLGMFYYTSRPVYKIFIDLFAVALVTLLSSLYLQIRSNDGKVPRRYYMYSLSAFLVAYAAWCVEQYTPCTTIAHFYVLHPAWHIGTAISMYHLVQCIHHLPVAAHLDPNTGVPLSLFHDVAASDTF